MWIKTKEKDALYDISGIRIQHITVPDIYVLEGIITGSDSFIMLGEYKSYKEAEEKLNKFEEYLNLNAFTL